MMYTLGDLIVAGLICYVGGCLTMLAVGLAVYAYASNHWGPHE
jgi:hypothetical protein